MVCDQCTPYGRDTPSQRSSEIFGRITEKGKMKFFARQAARRSEKEYLAFDTTTVSSYSQSLKQAKYGKNKEGDSLAYLIQFPANALYGFLDPYEEFMMVLKKPVYVGFTIKAAVHDQANLGKLKKIDILKKVMYRLYIRDIAG